MNSGLNPREREVLVLTARGWSDKLIARGMQISPGTVNSHLRSIYRKLGVHSRVEAVVKAMRSGLLPEEA